jgi:thiol:disulfide interchange protein
MGERFHHPTRYATDGTGKRGRAGDRGLTGSGCGKLIGPTQNERSPTIAMKKFLLLFLTLLVLLPAQAAGNLPEKFDPARDAAADVATAVAMAQAQGKRVLVDVGGEWCSWCRLLDGFFAANADARKLRDDHYVWVKVNWSPDNRNETVLSRWPRIQGYPHLFVLDGTGRLIHSQNTGLLEAGDDYDKARILAFLRQYRTPTAAAR